jgi:hypothetical protein
MLLAFAFTLFVSATLLFLLEPMVGKMILPLLGGTPAVWNTCMVFFQAILLAGYAYAHATTSGLGPRKQAAFHLAVLVLPFFFFPLAVNRGLLEGGEEHPVFPLLLMLVVCVGVPLFVVCTSAPLLQKWFAGTAHPAARDPYFLYGASNLGSMIALLAYPVLVEPHWKLGEQTSWWIVGYTTLAALTAVCAVFVWRSRPAAAAAAVEPKTLDPTGIRAPTAGEARGRGRDRRSAGQITTAPAAVAETPPAARDEAPTWGRRLRWVLLAAVPSSLMLGATTYITTDIAAIPLLWVIPLALYLLSFILVFAHLNPRVQTGLLGVGALAVSGLVMVVAARASTDLGDRTVERISWIAVRLAAVAALALFLLWIHLTHFDRRVKGILRVVAATAAAVGLLILAGPYTTSLDTTVRVCLGICASGLVLAWWAWDPRSGDVLHRGMILAMPLLVLALVFFNESQLGRIEWRIALHLVTLFVVAMVCHGELARDRPATRYLTGYYLWMSAGGVVGGLFNALVAPLIFNGIYEYSLVLVLACVLLPPLGGARESGWGRIVDVSLALLMVVIGGVLIGCRVRDHDLLLDRLAAGPWGWELIALGLGLVLAVVAALRGGRQGRVDRWLDLLLPVGLAVLVVGLVWGLQSNVAWGRVVGLAEWAHLTPNRVFLILYLGVPAILCYTFVERSARFGLGLGALLLAIAFAGGLSTWDRSPPLFQKRSFFGVLKVEESDEKYQGEVIRAQSLVHGTTLHGKQFNDPNHPELDDYPSTYYHHTGPIGQVFGAYNEASKPFAVIGLGTGTMACYALPGQDVTFFDIDPIVRDLSFRDETARFTFVRHARQRGAHMHLELGDARVRMERLHLADKDKYHLLVVDAFSSDAIPIHLITREALEVYRQHMAPGGVICFHISNRHLDLKPVLANLARELGMAALYQSDDDNEDLGKTRSTWVVLAEQWTDLAPLAAVVRTQQAMTCVAGLPAPGPSALGLAVYGAAEKLRPRFSWKHIRPDTNDPDAPDPARVGVWTDDYSNLLSVFIW